MKPSVSHSNIAGEPGNRRHHQHLAVLVDSAVALRDIAKSVPNHDLVIIGTKVLDGSTRTRAHPNNIWTRADNQHFDPPP
jgi:hypothetical protein